MFSLPLPLPASFSLAFLVLVYITVGLIHKHCLEEVLLPLLSPPLLSFLFHRSLRDTMPNPLKGVGREMPANQCN